MVKKRLIWQPNGDFFQGKIKTTASAAKDSMRKSKLAYPGKIRFFSPLPNSAKNKIYYLHAHRKISF